MFDWFKNKRKKYTIRLLDESWVVLNEYKSDIIPSKDELYLFDEPLQYYQVINLIHNTKGNNFITVIVKKIEISLTIE